MQITVDQYQRFAYIADGSFPSSSPNTSPLHSPPVATFNKHIQSPVDEKLEELAGNIFLHCNQALENEVLSPYEIPQYPIAESQQRERQLQRQRSIK